MVVADKGYDSEKLREFVRDNNATPVIPRKGNSLVGNGDIDWCIYKYRPWLRTHLAVLSNLEG